MNRRLLLLSAGALGMSLTSPAWCADPASDFVGTNIQAGFDILNDKSASAGDRRTRFAAFLMGLTDMKRVALFLLGRYAAGASQTDLDAYFAAYQDYVLSVYQSYFARYAGESLRVASSRERAPGDYVVTTNLVGASPMQIDFRVRTDGAKPLLWDIAVAGVWLGLAQRDQFLSVLAQNNGDIKALTAHLRSAQAR